MIEQCDELAGRDRQRGIRGGRDVTVRVEPANMYAWMIAVAREGGDRVAIGRRIVSDTQLPVFVHLCFDGGDARVQEVRRRVEDGCDDADERPVRQGAHLAGERIELRTGFVRVERSRRRTLESLTERSLARALALRRRASRSSAVPRGTGAISHAADEVVAVTALQTPPTRELAMRSAVPMSRP